MSESGLVHRGAKNQIPNPPKKFSKVRLMQILGLLNKELNNATLRFEPSLLFSGIFYSSLLLTPLYCVKLFISNFFPKNHRAQLIIGSNFNYLAEKPRIFFGVVASIVQCTLFRCKNHEIRVTLFVHSQGIITGLWSLFFHFVFNYLNARNDHWLFRFWIILTFEVPVKNDKFYKVAGLSKKEGKNFWAKENRINYVWFRVLNWYTGIIAALYSTQLFFVR